MEDLFMREHIEDLLQNIRTLVLIHIINLPHISMELNIDVTEVENLLVSCKLDKLKYPHVHVADTRPSSDDEEPRHLDFTSSNFHHLRATIDITDGVCSLEKPRFMPLLLCIVKHAGYET